MREEIKTITFNNSGYLYCKSNFYTSHDTLQEQDKFHFHKGVNKLVCDINSGIWGVSYLLSMKDLGLWLPSVTHTEIRCFASRG